MGSKYYNNDMKKKKRKYQKMKISIVKTFVTGFLCSIGFFIISYLAIIHCVASNPDAYTVFHDYIIAEELPALREFRVFVKNNNLYVDGWYNSEDIPTHDPMLLNRWVEEHHFQSLTILNNSTVNIYVYNRENFFNLFNIPTLYAFENRDFARPIHFKDGVYDVFINTGAASQFYLSIIIICLLAGVLLSLLIIFFYISGVVKDSVKYLV